VGEAVRVASCKRIALAFVLSVSGVLGAAELPDAPSSTVSAAPRMATVSRPNVRERFWTPRAKWELGGQVALRAADIVLTCRLIAAGGYEQWLPVKSCAGVAAWIAGGQLASTVAQWALWRRGRRSRQLAHWLPWAGMAQSAAGISWTGLHGSWHPRRGVRYQTTDPSCYLDWNGERYITRCR
jgi:hypothetical protein